jgi:hypothetical protein
MTPAWIDRLLADPAAPIDAIMATVHGEDVRAVINALFDAGLRVQHRDPGRALACVTRTDRIQAHAKPRGP